MKFRHLEYFVAATEELNFTHAANRMQASQPPFSKQIHELEGKLLIDLFERHRKGVALTPAGKSFFNPGNDTGRPGVPVFSFRPRFGPVP
jgi:DNA-binding transcriptional LysR family regulator